MKHCYMYIPFATIRNVFVSHIQIVILKKIQNFAIKFTLTKQINHLLEMIWKEDTETTKFIFIG